MAGKTRHPQEDLAVLALASGKSQAEAARESGLSVRTISRRLQTDDFCERIEETKAQLLTVVVDDLKRAGVHAVAKLRNLLDSDSDQVALGAARAILENLCRMQVHCKPDGHQSSDFDHNVVKSQASQPVDDADEANTIDYLYQKILERQKNGIVESA